MKKVVKKQLKEDEFVSTLTKVLRFIQGHTKEIAIGAAAVAFLALVYVGLRLVENRNLRKESRILTQMLELRAELAAKPENLARLEKLSGRGKFSRFGHVLLATYWIEQGDLEKAKASLKNVGASRKDFIYYQARELEAQILVRQKQFDGAIAIYDQILKDQPDDYGLDVVLFHKAEALEAKGQSREALEVYKKIQTDFPQSYFGYEASAKARKLESAGAVSGL